MREPAAHLMSITKEYRDGAGWRRVLDQVSVEVDAGSMVAVVGPSGCGKTTLLSVAAGLLRPDSGRAIVCGEELDFTSRSAVARIRRQHIGLILQTYGLIEAESVAANVALPLTFGSPRPSPRERAAIVDQALGRAGLEVDSSRLVRGLSHGEKQRVAIARALVRSPGLLVADEPTAALDRETGAQIVALLRSLADCDVGILGHPRRAGLDGV